MGDTASTTSVGWKGFLLDFSLPETPIFNIRKGETSLIPEISHQNKIKEKEDGLLVLERLHNAVEDQRARKQASPSAEEGFSGGKGARQSRSCRHPQPSCRRAAPT